MLSAAESTHLYRFVAKVNGLPLQGQGETLSQRGRVAGYANVSQKFDAPGYFQGCPSAVDYNTAGSAGSDKGGSNPEPGHHAGPPRHVLAPEPGRDQSLGAR
ncbi:potassium-transporting ATPase subunit C [Hymenobacter elongatus]|uniref:Potassium-transporting ATPase subunit C n=1 Tax=Hymenobacter elongatus TaxID=877208 RepID=A0A4Z0PPK8_9BACT|nr:potassium-transporting ATPase subunit C [Hymenobacter elongatus]